MPKLFNITSAAYAALASVARPGEMTQSAMPNDDATFTIRVNDENTERLEAAMREDGLTDVSDLIVRLSQNAKNGGLQ